MIDDFCIVVSKRFVILYDDDSHDLRLDFDVALVIVLKTIIVELDEVH